MLRQWFEYSACVGMAQGVQLYFCSEGIFVTYEELKDLISLN
jgi:hypothetical protein